MKKVWYHFIFWLFIALYDFDYLYDLFGLRHAVVYTLFEVIIFAFEFYVNLFFLLRIVLEKRGNVVYGCSLLLLLSFSFSLYYVTSLNQYLLGPYFPRAVSTFLLNHLLYILMSYLVWHFYKFELEKQKRLQLENEKLLFGFSVSLHSI